MNNLIIIDIADLDIADIRPRIHMKPFDKSQNRYSSIYGALKFKDDEFMGLAYSYEDGTKLYYYDNEEHGVLFCDEEMDKRICERLTDLAPEGQQYTRCLNRDIN